MTNDWRLYIGDEDYLEHHGIKGQKWGVRRFQNADGTLTSKGQKRYGEKVTMHKGGKENLFIGKNTYQTHKEFKTANKFAKASYKQRKEAIKEEKRNDTEKGALKRSIQKQLDNNRQYQYELDRNRVNAGKTEFKREIATGAAKKGAKAAAIVGANILAGYLAVNVANAVNDRMRGGVSKNRNALATLGANKVDQHYEYSIGKAQVAKYIGKAVAVGALYGAVNSATKTMNASNNVYEADSYDKRHTLDGQSRRERAAEDERRWKKGQV